MEYQSRKHLRFMNVKCSPSFTLCFFSWPAFLYSISFSQYQAFIQSICTACQHTQTHTCTHTTIASCCYEYTDSIYLVLFVLTSRFETQCICFILLHNKLPNTQQLNMACIYYFTVSGSQESETAEVPQPQGLIDLQSQCQPSLCFHLKT